MSTLSSANVTEVNLVLKERTHMRLCINMLIFMHNLGNCSGKLSQSVFDRHTASLCLYCITPECRQSISRSVILVVAAPSTISINSVFSSQSSDIPQASSNTCGFRLWIVSIAISSRCTVQFF